MWRMNFGLLFSLFLVFVNGFCATRRRAQYTAKPLYSRLLHQDGSSLKELCADKSPYYEGKATLMGNGESDRSHLALVGGGIFFYWQAGVIEYLREQDYDLNSCTFSGASAGALTATLAATEVDFYEATDLALKMAADVGVWDRRGGLQGIWGPLIEEWLQTLLPPSIENIEGRLSLLVTPVPSFGKKKISTFLDKNDLIKCNMASVHLPWFLDGRLTSSFRDEAHIDGSFLSKARDYLPPKGTKNVLLLDWSKDPEMQSKGGLDIVEALSPTGIWGLVERGKVYAEVMEQNGTFEGLQKAKQARKSPTNA